MKPLFNLIFDVQSHGEREAVTASSSLRIATFVFQDTLGGILKHCLTPHLYA